MTLSYQDDRANLTVGHAVRYALGDPLAPAVTLNAADTFGCAWLADEPDGWDAPTVVSPIDSRQDGHGGYLGTSHFEARTLPVEGMVTGPSPEALRAARDRLLGTLLGSLSGFVRYTHLDDAPAKGLWVRPVGKPRFRFLDDRAAEFAFVLLAEDPIKTGAAVTYGPVRLLSPAGEGGYANPGVGPWTAVSSATLTETRRNRVPNPIPTSTNSWFGNAGTGGTATTSYVSTGGPGVGGMFRATYTVANSTAVGASSTASLVADGRAAAPLPIPVTAGQVYSAAIYARTSIAQRLACVLRWYDAAGAAVGTAATGTHVVLGAAAWTRLTLDGATAPAGATHCRVEVVAQAGTGAVPFTVGSTFDTAQAQVESTPTIGVYFDGNTDDTATANYGWETAASGSHSLEQTVAYSSAAAAGPTVAAVANPGDVSAHATYRMTGPNPSPGVILGTGEFFGLNLTLGALDTAVVSTAEGTVQVNGVNRYDAWRAGSTFPVIPPGGLDVRYTSFGGGTDQTAALYIDTAPAWK